MAFEFLPDLRCIVMCQSSCSPSDAEWDSYLEQLQKLSADLPVRVFVQTDGGRPSPEQQKKLTALAGDRDLRTAVVSAAVPVRFVVSSLSLYKRDVRFFTPPELDAALEYLNFDAQEQAVVRQALERLRAAIAG